MKHVVVYRAPGRFAGWPANGGMWSWGDEILVGFRLGWFQMGNGFHAMDRTRPAEWAQARSLDGGENWSLEHPEIAPFTGKTKPSETTGLEEPLDFSRPELILEFGHSGMTAGASSWFQYSYDRGRTWKGPCGFSTLGLPGIAARTDHMPSGTGRLFFLTAAKRNGDEGHAFCARTDDGAKSFRFVSWIGPEPEGWTIMPASARLPDSRIIVALRCRNAGSREAGTERHWIDLYASDDEGETWKYVNCPSENTGMGGNPPTLTLLPDGRLVIVYGYRAAPFGMRAVVSGDGGASWGTEIVLRSDGGNHDIGYPRTVLRPDGALVSAYYYDDRADGERYIAATVWRP